MLRTAIALAKKGLAVFPCLPRSKLPSTPDGHKSATKNPDMIRHWWGLEPQANVAIATGAVSGIFVVDIDGLDAERELRGLEAEHGELPATVEVITPRPGRHIYFRMPDAPVRNSAGRLAPGCDVRATGGYTLCPPSVHPSGAVYCWSVDCAKTFAEAPDWLLAKIADTNGNGTATPSGEWQTLLAHGIAEGTRDVTLARLTGHLLRRYVDPRLVLELMQATNAARCMPPLPVADVCRIVNSICGAELKRRGHHG